MTDATPAVRIVPEIITPEMAKALEENFAPCVEASEVHAANWQAAWTKCLAAAPGGGDMPTDLEWLEADRAVLRRRIADLLEANNRYLERARSAEAALRARSEPHNGFLVDTDDGTEWVEDDPRTSGIPEYFENLRPLTLEVARAELLSAWEANSESSARSEPEAGAVDAQTHRLLQLADAALANVTAFESDARYIMGDTNYAITDNVRSEIRRFLLAHPAPSDASATERMRAALEGLTKACLASDFNEHWDEYVEARAALGEVLT